MNDIAFPSLYQINTRVWLNQISQKTGNKASLDDIPDRELDELADLGFDWVYFLSIWQIGEVGRNISRSNPQWLEEYRETFPEFQNEDICGSGFAITSYTLNSNLGALDSLLRLRDRLHQRGLKLMLDFVPNHTAIDSAWVGEHPEYYVGGSENDLREQPQNYIKLSLPRGETILAYGRDPYFSGWVDTLQLNYGNPALQSALIDELLKISQWCDGLRCDMAMLVLPEIFKQTWGVAIEPFWKKAIDRVKEGSPDFTFMGEVYWDLEWKLQQQGFDYTYDKRLYDRLRDRHARSVKEHFWADLNYQKKSTRFLENHDEPRAASIFPERIHRAAALISFFCSGMRFFHQGQLQGWTKKISVHLCRFPEQPTNPNLQEFYGQILEVLHQDLFRNGEWHLLNCKPAWSDNWTWDCFVGFAWQNREGQKAIVVVNYAGNQSQCFVHMPWDVTSKLKYVFKDLVGSESYIRNGEELANRGLYLDLPPWGYHIFKFHEE
ncbi:alpha-amylase family glycosyl hydrolase [Pseudanabaena sp. 'Roaring Creek']|uniref:alpha-amylase family glycosyl hydrolase n=1 Tax=Pseudanabaena sp. 'Roaring Creek' TaxID=1681830 RepID=UPI0006D77630|nr:alpha-amylase family glycosyl hydrolase [Pseudanabaena sp. 'Roaring Creek']